MAHKPDFDQPTGVHTTGHEWDGLQELNNPMPRWWLTTWYVTIVWSVIYWILMPSWPLLTDYTRGLLRYTQRGELAREMRESAAARAGVIDRIKTSSLTQIDADPELRQVAIAGGRSAFGNNCIACHGAGGQGGVGYPNLNDDDWLWGNGSLDSIYQTLQYGIRSGHPEARTNEMPAFGKTGLLTEAQIGDLVAFVAQVAHHARTITMTDPDQLRSLIEDERPGLVVPEIEAIATDVLAGIEAAGLARVIPTARATQLTMNREGIRRLAAEELGLPTSPYAFAGSAMELGEAAARIGLPVFVKPVMSSSGKGQSTVREETALDGAWDYAVAGMRGDRARVIAEQFIDFDYEITLLTVRTRDGVVFCPPIGHRQERGDYRESWQPAAMSEAALREAHSMATKVVDALGGYGLFGVEFFVKGDRVIFSELSPRPHDTGMVTLVSQTLSEFDLHARAILGLPIPPIGVIAPSASAGFFSSPLLSWPSSTEVA